MRDGRCPKCGQTTVHAARSGLRLGEYPWVFLYPHVEPDFRGVLHGHRCDGLWQYVCVSCGHLEMYVIDEAALAFVRGGWLPVPASPPEEAPAPGSLPSEP